MEHKYKTYNQNKTLYNIDIKHRIKISIFATFQLPYLSSKNENIIQHLSKTY